jgi:hypothetical protein
MKWLYFSDFHIGKDRSLENEVLINLISVIKALQAPPAASIDAVFFVGDIAYSGNKEEYRRFAEIFLTPLKECPGLENALYYAVPGNHDVDCSKGYPISWDSIRARLQKVFFAEDGDGRMARSQRVEVFTAFQEFVEEWGIHSPNATKEVSALLPSLEGLQIIGTNTAFFSDFEEDSSAPITPSPLPSLRSVVESLDPNLPCILLGHHSIECLRPEQQTAFVNFLVEKRLVYFHGHEHKHRLDPNIDGTIRRIGFGAVYENSLTGESALAYRNSFAIGEGKEPVSLRVYSWEPTLGRWVESTPTHFSSAYSSPVLGSEPLNLRFPYLHSEDGEMQNSTAPTAVEPLSKAARRPLSPATIIPLGDLSPRVWTRILSAARTGSTSGENTQVTAGNGGAKDGKAEFILEGESGRRLLICIPAPGHLLASSELQVLNTRLDTDDIDSITIVSFGRISSDAAVMYARIKSKRAIEIYINQDLAKNVEQLMSVGQQQRLTAMDPSRAQADIIASGEQLYLLIIEDFGTSKSFCVVAPDGKLLSSGSELVIKLRESSAHIAGLKYSSDRDQVEDGHAASDDFDRNEYLRRCHKECNQIRYAALANIGIRTEEYTLNRVYVDATATEIDTGEDSRIDQIIDDHLAIYPTSESLRHKIRERLLESVHSNGTGEASNARAFCQRFGSVLLTGDPGSGKTCFVKNEILAYCDQGLAKSDGQVPTWYSEHLPIYVSLAQVVAEESFEEHGFLLAASEVLQKRGLIMPPSVVLEALQTGSVALYLDGLDEIVSVEKRALMVQRINEMITRFLPLGNRITVTSRPAAVQVVNLLPSMHELALRGLSEQEIRLLATRILQLHVVEGKEGITLDETELRQKDGSVIETLLHDCRENPGVMRLAQNPLLLTLLVMIYANAGAPSAKRHLIYDEAIKTLAAVRGRTAGHHPVSAQDLRVRLGCVAISVYRKESGFLPTWSEFRAAVQVGMSQQLGADSSAAEADSFIRRVAESTGLIAISSQVYHQERQDDAVVTFMHHSFLEYFAAIGLSREFDEIDLHEIIREPRWHEVLTLLAGVIGERDDIAPVIQRVLGSSTDVDDVDSRTLQFAIDCALECDVPSEGALRMILNAVKECVRTGPAKIDPWVRAELGQRLGQLWMAAGPTVIEEGLGELLDCHDPEVCAAAVRIVSHVFESGIESDILVAKIEELNIAEHDIVVEAICVAIGRCAQLRSEILRRVIAKALKGSKRVSSAAFEALSKNQMLASENWSEVINGIEGDSTRRRQSASIAAIRAGLDPELLGNPSARRDVILRAFEAYERAGYGSEEAFPSVPHGVVTKLYKSGILSERKLGICLVPFIDGDGETKREMLMASLEANNSREEWVSALRSFRWSSEARIVCRQVDLRQFMRLFEVGTSDVREAALNLLGCFPADAPVVQFLGNCNVFEAGNSEFQAWAQALARVEIKKEMANERFERLLTDLIRSDAKGNKFHWFRMNTVLEAVRRLGCHLDDRLSKKLEDFISEYRIDVELRKRALLAYATTTLPSERYVTYLAKQIDKPQVRFESALVKLPGAAAANCRQDIDYVIACISSLQMLRTEAIKLHRKLAKREVSTQNSYYVTELRSGIDDLGELIAAFNEYIR